MHIIIVGKTARKPACGEGDQCLFSGILLCLSNIDPLPPSWIPFSSLRCSTPSVQLSIIASMAESTLWMPCMKFSNAVLSFSPYSLSSSFSVNTLLSGSSDVLAYNPYTQHTRYSVILLPIQWEDVVYSAVCKTYLMARVFSVVFLQKRLRSKVYVSSDLSFLLLLPLDRPPLSNSDFLSYKKKKKNP